MLKERVNRPEDEVPSRVCLVRHPLGWCQARSSVLLEDLLVRCDPNRSGREDDQETCPSTHIEPSEILRVKDGAWLDEDQIVAAYKCKHLKKVKIKTASSGEQLATVNYFIRTASLDPVNHYSAPRSGMVTTDL